MASLITPQSPPCKHTVPPAWYALQTSECSSEPYIALPSSPDNASDTTTPSTPRIFLTTFHTTDARALQAILDTPSINDSLISIPKPYTLADAHTWINLQLPSGTGAPQPWLQALRCGDPETGTFIGAVSLVPAASSSYAVTTAAGAADVAERARRAADDQNENGNDINDSEDDYYVLGYYLHLDFRRRGIMRDAVLALLAWAAAERGVKRVRVDVAADNLGSRRLVESLDVFEKDEEGGGEQELVWPESKGGVKRKILTWRWTSP